MLTFFKNFCDTIKSQMWGWKKAKKIVKKFKFIKYFECSAKAGENVDKIFEFLTRAIMKSEGYF
ncbi:MAG: hypothetical protein KGD63_07120 [Candidatus Lokiarchaeota archaeon]|nr:hypothetical protein [Candidatus Lokiarchaeota archaeon]